MKTELFQLMFYPADTHHFHWNLMLGPISLPPLYMDCNYVCPLTFDEARKLEGETIKQASSDAWFKARRTDSPHHAFTQSIRE